MDAAKRSRSKRDRTRRGVRGVVTGKLDLSEAAARLESRVLLRREPRLASMEEPVEAPVEIIFEVTEAPEGGFDARALGHSIFTQGEDWADLKAMVTDAVRCHFGDGDEQRVVRLHFVKDEAIAV